MQHVILTQHLLTAWENGDSSACEVHWRRARWWRRARRLGGEGHDKSSHYAGVWTSSILTIASCAGEFRCNIPDVKIQLKLGHEHHYAKPSSIAAYMHPMFHV
jgi:hypothetical protein